MAADSSGMGANPNLGSKRPPTEPGRSAREPAAAPPSSAAASTESRAAVERQALTRVAAAAAGASDLEGVLELAAEEALQAIGGASLTISRFEPGKIRYRTLINVGQLGEWEERFPVDEIYEVTDFPRLVEMACSAKPYFNSLDDPDCDPASAAFLRSVGKTSDLGVAILIEGEI